MKFEETIERRGVHPLLSAEPGRVKLRQGRAVSPALRVSMYPMH